MPLRLDIVTIERNAFTGDVDMVTAPGIDGELGILPRHAPLMTALKEGELRLLKGDEVEYFAIGGGFMEVRPDHVIVLADSAELADEIDIERAEAARERAEQMLSQGATKDQIAAIEGALRRSRIRLKVARRRRRSRTDSG